MKLFKRFLFINLYLFIFKNNKNINLNDLNFKKLDFSNYKQIKSFIFKDKFYNLKNKYVQNFDFLNFSQNLGGKIGIGLSKNSIFSWFKINKKKINYPWINDLSSKRLINLVYNYEFISSSCSSSENYLLKKIIFFHINRVLYEFKNKNENEISSDEIKASILSYFILGKINNKIIIYAEKLISNQIDNLGVHKSYNILEHAKFINNLNELKSIFLYFNYKIPEKINSSLLSMKSILNQYFHVDSTLPLFNGSNNNYTKIIYESLNKEEYLKSRNFNNSNNGIAFYSDKYKKIFFDVVQPNKDGISRFLSAGTLSFEFSSGNEKIITNCGASESAGSNPEFLRYSAAHSTIVLQNTNVSEIKESNPLVKFPQMVSFESNSNEKYIVFEGSHNGYKNKFNQIVKRRLHISKLENKLFGEDSIISLKKNKNRIFYHIRFHLMYGMSFNFTNNKKNIILKTKNNNMWLFKSDSELLIDDSIHVDNNNTQYTKQIVIKGIINNTKHIKKWSIEKI